MGDYTASFYAEHGLSDAVTVLGYAPFVERLTLNEVVSEPSGTVIAAGDTATGVADWEVGARFRLARGRRSVLSAGVLLGIPLGDSEQPSGLLTGDGEFNQVVTLQAGRSFERSGLYVTGEVGFNNRTRGYSDEWRYGVEAGLGLGRRVIALVKVRGVRSLENGDDAITGGATGLYSNNQEYLVVAPEIVVRFNGSFGVAAGAERPLSGRNLLSAPAYSLGFVWTM